LRSTVPDGIETLQSSPRMLYRIEKISWLPRMRELAFFGAFSALTLLAMAGWMYLMGSIFLRFVLWCIYYFVQ
jgi:hypothetical protein